MAKKKKKSVNKNAWFRKRVGAMKKGWGFIPINWKGTAALAILIIVNVFAALYFDLNVFEGRRWAKFGVVFLLSISLGSIDSRTGVSFIILRVFCLFAFCCSFKLKCVSIPLASS